MSDLVINLRFTMDMDHEFVDKNLIWGKSAQDLADHLMPEFRKLLDIDDEAVWLELLKAEII
jgi:hypothetical protein